jgi:hypothetical protein
LLHTFIRQGCLIVNAASIEDDAGDIPTCRAQVALYYADTEGQVMDELKVSRSVPCACRADRLFLTSKKSSA